MVFSYSFYPRLPPHIHHMKNILFTRNQANFTIKFLWASSYSGILGNAITDNLASSTISLPFPCRISSSDFLLILHQHCLWFSYWNGFPADFASKYKSVVPNKLKKIWLNNLKLSRTSIIQLWVSHYLFSSHYYKLSL